MVTAAVQPAAKQGSFDFDFTQREPTSYEYGLDFTGMQIGHVVGDECRVIRCPKCSKNCIARENARRWTFIHEANIRTTPRRTWFEATVTCTLDHQDMQTLRDLGVVTCNRLGQILEVK